MAQEFDPIEEVRKHPGVAAGVVFVLAGIGLATLLLNQRTGPRRYELLRERFDPRGWVDTGSMRARVGDLARGVRDNVDELGQRASELGETVHHRAGRFGGRFRQGFGHGHKGGRHRHRKVHRYQKQARRYAEDAGDFAMDHAREGGAILAVAAIAAAIGAVAWESHKKGGGLLD